MIGKVIATFLLFVVAFLAIASGHLFVLAENNQRAYSCVATPGTLPATVPEPLNSIVTKAAAEYGTDPIALAVLFHNENGWTFDRELPPPYGNGRQWNSSPVGARGPMQFMPTTSIGYINSNPAHQPGDVMDLTDAVYMAAHYLSDLGGKVGAPLGSPETVKERPTLLNAIVSYHSGEGFPTKANRGGLDANGLGPAGRQYASKGYEAYRSLQANGGLQGSSTDAVIEPVVTAVNPCTGGGTSTTLQAGEWHPPITDPYRISSAFGWRIHPTLGTRKHHNGIDLAAPQGTEVYATMDGTITRSGWNGSYGNHVEIDHGGGTETGSAHLDSIAPGIGTVVKTVTAGDVIGYVGTTGRSTGNHLDQQVKVNGAYTDPVPFYRDRGVNL